MGFLKRLRSKPEQTSTAAENMGYETDGRSPRKRIPKGKQRMLTTSTKLLLDNTAFRSSNPYDANKRIDDNVYQMFSQNEEDVGKAVRRE
jgi:hypothetical protein